MVMRSPTKLPSDKPDICVVGMGPAGLTLALEAAKHGLSVLLIDAGSLEGTAVTDASDTITDLTRHAPLPLAKFKGFGGTSRLWGGRCVPFEAIDFQSRPYVPHSDWPCSYEELSPWYDIAADYLDCGDPVWHQPLSHWPALNNIAFTQQERWARQPQLAHKLKARVDNTNKITLLSNTQVIDIKFDQAGQHVRSLVAVQQEQHIEINATHFVLACGGVETTRLLLAIQARNPSYFAGTNGPLGRYYMGHIFGSIASIVLNNPADVADLDFNKDESGAYVRRRFTLSPEIQQQKGLLNTAFYIDNPPFYDAAHRNPTLSLIFLMLRIPAIGRKLISEAIRLRHVGPPPYRVLSHIANVLRNPLRVLADVVAILRDRYLSPVRKPGFILRNKSGIYALNYHAEQIPNPDSRIYLNQPTLAGQLPSVTIDFRYQTQDAISVLAAHAVLDQALRTSGKGYLHYHSEESMRLAHIMSQATDGFHQVGTTRMGNNANTSIVNSNGQVHHVDNLFIASSSVFPTTGEANPTLLLTAFAARMAHYIAGQKIR
jgi:glycine/D-amino acid oxidase-like deaminating enzyme